MGDSRAKTPRLSSADLISSYSGLQLDHRIELKGYKSLEFNSKADPNVSEVVSLRSGYVILTCLSDRLSGYLIFRVQDERVAMPKSRAWKWRVNSSNLICVSS
jgi:hypothetical protein